MSNHVAPTWVRVGLGLTIAVYITYSLFGIDAPFYWGHHGYHGATYLLRARMSLRFHLLAPATYSGYDYPPLAALYFHLPIGYHHILTLLVPIFGEHEWLPRAVAAGGGLLAMLSLYSLAKRFWSPASGLTAAVVFATLPIVTSFSVLSDPMMPTLACLAWSLRALLTLLDGGSPQQMRRALVEVALSYTLCSLLMWDPYFIGPFIAVFVTAYWFTPRGRSLRVGGPDGQRYSALWMHTWITGAVCVIMMAAHLYFTWHAGCWRDFIDSYAVRSAAPSPPYIVDRHTQWMQLLYGKPPMIIGALWFTLWLTRLATGRARRRDIAPLTFLYMNTIFIVMFPEGSAVHLYRVFVYAGFFCLAAADLVDAAYHGGVSWWGGGARSAEAQRMGVLLATTLMGVYLVLEVPRAWHNLLESRVMMGTHGLGGIYDNEADKLLFAQQATAATRPDERVIVHYAELGARKEMWFYLDRSFDELSSLTEMTKYQKTWGKSVMMLDERALSPPDRARFNELMKQHPVTFYGHYALVDLRSSTPGVRSYALEPDKTKMTPLYRFFVSHIYAPLKMVRRTYLPGACTAITLGVPVASDEEVAPPPPPNDFALRACYPRYLQMRGVTH